MIKKLIIKFLEKKGYVNKWSLTNTKNLIDSIYIILFSLQKKNYKIIQVGANDGFMSDPIYSFNKDYYNSISYIGFEPQNIPLEKLKNTYKGYKNFHFVKGCVGEEGRKKFFYLNKKYEKLCIERNWKFNDTLSSLVEENLAKRLVEKKLNPRDYIDNYEADVLPLKTHIEKNNLLENFKETDLLQIDAEGYDDKVIYNSSIEYFTPKFINFEYKNLSKSNLKELIKFLKNHSYECIFWKKNDCLAVLKRN